MRAFSRLSQTLSVARELCGRFFVDEGEEPVFAWEREARSVADGLNTLKSGKQKSEKAQSTFQMFFDFLRATARWRMPANQNTSFDTFHTRNNCVPQSQCLASDPSGRRLGASGGGAQSTNTTEHKAKHRVQSTRHRAQGTQHSTEHGARRREQSTEHEV